MKLHLPIRLRSALLAACALSFVPFSWATDYIYENNNIEQFEADFGEGSSYNGTGHTLTFQNNHNSDAESIGGGALSFLEDKEFDGFTSLRFLGNYCDETGPNAGGAIHCEGLAFNGCGSIDFSGNYTKGGSADGGAITCAGIDGVLSFSGCDNVTFSKNYVAANSTQAHGGAIMASLKLEFSSIRGTLLFEGNHADATGAALAAVGGAIDAEEDVTFQSCQTVLFRGNYAEGWLNPTSPHTYSEVTGGAVNCWGNLTFKDCTSIEFTGNYAKNNGTVDEEPGDDPYDPSTVFCGALYSSGSVVFDSNKSVLIRGNYVAEQRTGEWRYVLNAFESWEMEIKTKEGQTFTCYDAGYAGALYINGDKDTLAGQAQGDDNYTGTVTFSGKYTKDDLKALMKKEPSQEVIDASRIINARCVQVCDGTLALEDGMRLCISRSLYESSEYDYSLKMSNSARLAMKDAVIASEKTLYEKIPSSPEDTYWEDLGAGEVYISNASFTGSNSIYAHTLESTGGTWTFNVTADNVTKPLVSLKFHLDEEADNVKEHPGAGTFTSKAGTVFDIQYDTKTLGKGKYKLLEYDGSDGGTWSGMENVSITGLATSKSIGGQAGQGDVYLMTEGDTITLIYDKTTGSGGTQPTPPQRVPSTLTWSGGNGTWAEKAGADHWTSSVNDKNFYTGDSVVFNSAADVTIQGVVRPKSVRVDNATGTVKLTGTGQITDVDLASKQVATLTKEGAGTLEITTNNAYTGGTVLKAGTLVVGNAGALGLGTVTVSGGTLEMGGHAVSNEVHVAGNATLNGTAYAGKLVLQSGNLGGTLTAKGGVSVTGNASLSGSISGDIDVQEKGNLTLAKGSAFKGNISLNKGAGLSAPEDLVLGAEQSLTLKGGEAKANVSLDAGGTLAAVGSAGTITGNLALNGGTLDLAQSDGALNVAGDVSTGEKSTTVKVNLSDVYDKLSQAGGTFTQQLIHYTGSATGVSEKLTLEDALKNARSSISDSDNKISLLVSSEALTWSADTGVWAIGEAGEWETSADDKTFHNLDSVTFNGAGEVQIKGKVNPGSITVQGDEHTTFTDAKDGAGSITGQATLTKTGKGNLTINTDNSSYSGSIVVEGGTLTAGNKNALGTGSVAIQSATFDGGDMAIDRTVPIVFSGNSTIRRADNVKNIAFVSGSSVGGSYSLNKDNTLTIGPAAAVRTVAAAAADGKAETSFTGNFTFAGGTLVLNQGDVLDLTDATKVTFADGTTTIDVSSWGSDIVGQQLVRFDTSDSSVTDAALTHLRVESEGREFDFRIDEDGNVVVSGRGGYRTGAEFATAITSQVGGNLTHLRRVRNTIGSGQAITADGKVGAYVAAYSNVNRLEKDAQGPGYRRNEYGGTLGMETVVGKSFVIGEMLSAGRASVSPSTSSPSYHENAVHEDLYLVASFGRFRSTTTFGFGQHEFDLRCSLPGGGVASANNVNGKSVNFAEEIAFMLGATEKQSYETFFTVESSHNRIDSFIANGASTLRVDSQEAWATDLSIGLRGNYTLGAVNGAAPSVLSAHAAVISAVGDVVTDVSIRNGAGQYSTRSAKSNRWGYNLGASISVPVSKNVTIFGGAEGILRSDSREASATLGVKMVF